MCIDNVLRSQIACVAFQLKDCFNPNVDVDENLFK